MHFSNIWVCQQHHFWWSWDITIEKWSQICTRTVRNVFFKDILFLGSFPIVIPIVNSISNIDHEGVKLSCWNSLWLIRAPKNTIKTLSRDVWMFLTKIDTPYYIYSRSQEVRAAVFFYHNLSWERYNLFPLFSLLFFG